jgi:hypothetical protein
MFVKIKCPNASCGKPLKAPADKIGAAMRCPHCKETFVVPDAAAPIQITPPPTPPAQGKTNDNSLEGMQPAANPNAPAVCQYPQPQNEQVAVFSAKFLQCLHEVFDSDTEKDPDEYVAPLSNAFLLRRQRVADRRQRFLTNLKRVCDEEEIEDPDEFVEPMAGRLLDWRARTQQLMLTLLSAVPDDDPLKCPISLFGTLGLRRTETAHTSALAWLLDPDQPHGFGAALAGALLAYLLKNTGRSYSIAMVEKEHRVVIGDDWGRIDVFATGEWTDGAEQRLGWLLAVEAKIDASEGDGQLELYDRWLAMHRNGRQPIRVYLTAHGGSPEFGSQVFPEPWIPLSFLDLVRVFRESSLSLRGKPGFEFLRYYLTGVLKDIYRWEIPMPVPAACMNPYPFVSFLRTIQKSI